MCSANVDLCVCVSFLLTVTLRELFLLSLVFRTSRTGMVLSTSGLSVNCMLHCMVNIIEVGCQWVSLVFLNYLKGVIHTSFYILGFISGGADCMDLSS